MLVHQGEGEMKFLIPSHKSLATSHQSLLTNYTFIWPKMTYSLDTQRIGHFYFTGKLK